MPISTKTTIAIVMTITGCLTVAIGTILFTKAKTYQAKTKPAIALTFGSLIASIGMLVLAIP